MFVETITQPAAEWRHWDQQLGLTRNPPPALVASIAWAGDGDTITAVNVWDTPEAVAEFYLTRVRPIVEAQGEPTDKPVRHGAPIHVFTRT